MSGPARDIVIVGGGPAGTTAALALARRAPHLAARTVILERARYPRDKPCAGALGGRGDALLASLGARPDVPGVPVDGVSFRGLSSHASASPGGIGRVIRRAEFDHALARAASARGVALRDGVRVLAVHRDERGGARLETTEGEVRATAVVGCDGVGSVVRRALGVGAGEWRAQAIEVDTEPVAGDPPRTVLHFDASDPRLTGYAWDFPTLVAGRALVCRGIYRLRWGDARGDEPDLGALLDARLAAAGIDPAACRNKRYAERGFDPAARLAAGPLLLAGEAAGIDPATGEGIAQAIEYGILAGEFLADKLGRTPSAAASAVVLDDWTARVSRSRLARDLRIRTRLVRAFFGRRRAFLERVVTGSPDFLFVGCQHFAAQRLRWRRLAALGWRAAMALTGARPWRR